MRLSVTTVWTTWWALARNPIHLLSHLGSSLQLKNADYFSQYISDEDFDHYIDRKREDQCYGNNIEMQALAEMYNRPIEVYQYTTGEEDR
jgi:hypothetical protein